MVETDGLFSPAPGRPAGCPVPGIGTENGRKNRRRHAHQHPRLWRAAIWGAPLQVAKAVGEGLIAGALRRRGYPEYGKDGKRMKRQDYISWGRIFMGIALLTAQRSKDNSSQVGACIVSREKTRYFPWLQRHAHRLPGR